MKSTGIVRTVEQLGRYVLPIEMRRAFDIKYLDLMEIYADKDRIILQKYKSGCIFCGNADKVEDFRGRTVCEECKTVAATLL